MLVSGPSSGPVSPPPFDLLPRSTSYARRVTVIARRLHELPDSSYAPDEKVVALTFDDAPGPNTAPVLDTLAACRASATFFVVGQDVERDPELVARIADEGHAVGNHSWTHTRRDELDDADNPRRVLPHRRADQPRSPRAPVHRARPPFAMTQAYAPRGVCSTHSGTPRSWGGPSTRATGRATTR